MAPRSYAHSTTPSPRSEVDADARIADLGAFSRGLAHDLRNPLNVVVANIYLIRQRMADAGAKSLRPVERISDQVRVVEGMLNGYLAFEAAIHPVKQRVQVSDVVQPFLESLNVGDACELISAVEVGLSSIHADPRLLESALRALTRNSLRAMGSEGSLAVRAEAVEGEILIQVEDTGPGIPQEVLPRIFDPFFSTWDEHAGMGLPLAAKVARIHNGSILMETTPGEGSRCTLRLPTG